MAQKDSSTLIRFDEGEIQEFLGRTIKAAVQEVFESLLEAEATEMLKAAPYERTTARKDHRNGKRKRKLTTRVGEIELTVPRLRTIPFQSQIIDRFDSMASQYNFHLVDATRTVHQVFADLKKGIHKLVKGMKPVSPHITKK